VNEVANGLAGSQTALAVVRGGTANVWAKEARLPRKPGDALRVLEHGETREIDLGLAGERYFLLMAGVGFDAAIVREVSERLKRRFGAAAYALHGLQRAFGYRPTDAELIIDGAATTEPVHWLLLGNTRSYAGVVNITHNARLDDGELDLYLLRKGGPWRLALLFLQVLLGRHDRQRDVLYRRVASCEVGTTGLPVQVDGEYLGETPMRFAVARRALRVIVPAGLKSPLFSG
jgi:YegS/Rv2252/BmrU family lipid kinase